MAQYKVSEEDREEYFKELERWINNGWLVPVERNKNGIIPLMCVKQEAKGKVRPVLDFREVNKFIHSHTMDTIAVSESLRKWRKMSGNCKIIDLKNAYLQIHVEKDLWEYQRVFINDCPYQLTRLDFIMASAPKIMNRI